MSLETLRHRHRWLETVMATYYPGVFACCNPETVLYWLDSDKSIPEVAAILGGAPDTRGGRIHMLIVRATVNRTALNGCELWDKPIGTVYYVDLHEKREATWTRKDDPNFRGALTLVPDVMRGGWVPLEILTIDSKQVN